MWMLAYTYSSWVYWEWYAIKLYMFCVIFIFPFPPPFYMPAWFVQVCWVYRLFCRLHCVCTHYFPHLCTAVELWVGLYLDLRATHLTICETCSLCIVHDMYFQQNACNNTIMQWAFDLPFPLWWNQKTFLSILFWLIVLIWFDCQESFTKCEATVFNTVSYNALHTS